MLIYVGRVLLLTGCNRVFSNQNVANPGCHCYWEGHTQPPPRRILISKPGYHEMERVDLEDCSSHSAQHHLNMEM